jgi:hypothetical protein
MNGLIDFFIEISPDNALILLRALMLKWPTTNAGKQAVLLNYFTKAIFHLRSAALANYIVPVIRILGSMSSSPCERVASAALLLWSRPEADRILLEFGRICIPVLLPCITSVSDAHWSAVVRTNAGIVIEVFQQRDFTRWPTKSAMSARVEASHQFGNWSAIAKAASEADEEISFTRAMSEISARFGTSSIQPRLRRRESALTRPRAFSGLPQLR